MTLTYQKAMAAERERVAELDRRADVLLSLQDVYSTAERIDAEALLDAFEKRGLRVVRSG